MGASTITDLLTQAYEIYRRNARLVLVVTVPIIVFVTLVTALGLGELDAHYRPGPPPRDSYIELAAIELVMAPLVSAILARLVVLERSRQAVVAADLVAGALEVFPSVLLVIVAWLLVVFIGSTLIVPGIYFLVAWYFVVQAVVIDGDRGFAPISRSATLVRGNWWRSASVGLAFYLAAAVPQAILVVVFAAIARSANAYVWVVLGTMLATVIAQPFLAIGASVYYLQLRDEAARRPLY